MLYHQGLSLISWQQKHFFRYMIYGSNKMALYYFTSGLKTATKEIKVNRVVQFLYLYFNKPGKCSHISAGIAVTNSCRVTFNSSVSKMLWALC